jgi:hypothetical protein
MQSGPGFKLASLGLGEEVLKVAGEKDRCRKRASAPLAVRRSAGVVEGLVYQLRSHAARRISALRIFPEAAVG